MSWPPEHSFYRPVFRINYSINNDATAAEWPVYANGCRIGTVAEVERGYCAYRGGPKDGGPPEEARWRGPERSDRGEAMADLLRWFERPLAHLTEWIEEL